MSHRRGVVRCALWGQQSSAVPARQSREADRRPQAQPATGKAAHSGCRGEGGLQQLLAGHLAAQERAAWQWACCLPLPRGPQLQGAPEVSSAFEQCRGDISWPLLQVSTSVSTLQSSSTFSPAHTVTACLISVCVIGAHVTCRDAVIKVILMLP